MELIYAVIIPIFVIGVGFLLLQKNQGVPPLIQKLINLEPTIWTFGVILIGTLSIIKYLADQ